MNNRTVSFIAFAAVAAAAAAASPAFAHEITMEPYPFVSTMSRAEVRAGLDQHRAGGVNPWADDHDQLRSFQGSRSRADVVGEYLAERQLVAAMSGEDSGSMHLALHTRSLPAPALALASISADAE